MTRKETGNTNKNATSMKDAFAKLSPRKKSKKKNLHKKRTLKDFFWDYPENTVRFFKMTSPISTILLFALLGFLIFSFLRSDFFAENITTKKYKQYIEGRIGAISTFNPLFSNQNDVDQAIQELVFEKFIYIDINGAILPGIATSWSVGVDGKSYEFNISLGHKWSDDTPLTISDVLFTFETAVALSRDAGYDTAGSSLKDVAITVVDEDTIKFQLPESNATFPEVISVYIVPKHILENVSLTEMPFNIFSRSPIGSGPYRVYKSDPNVVYLKSSESFQPSPKISDIIVRIYSETSKLEAAFRNGLLDAIILPYNQNAQFLEEYSSYIINRIDLPYRERVLFFNMRKEKLQSEELRKGISYLIDKELLLEQSGIFGSVISGPIFNGNWAYSSDVENITYDPTKALEFFKSAGYTKNEQNGYFQTVEGKLLTLTVSYLKNDSNENFLNTLKSLLDKEGVIINLEPFSYSQLTQEILATRNFEILMYEIELSVDPDQYNLWHSLQKEYPNLNISGYEYERVDILLESARRKLDQTQRKKDYALFQKYLVENAPAVFLYRPSYLYVVRDNIQGLTFENIVRLEDVYRNSYNWEFIQ